MYCKLIFFIYLSFFIYDYKYTFINLKNVWRYKVWELWMRSGPRSADYVNSSVPSHVGNMPLFIGATHCTTPYEITTMTSNLIFASLTFPFLFFLLWVGFPFPFCLHLYLMFFRSGSCLFVVLQDCSLIGFWILIHHDHLLSGFGFRCSLALLCRLPFCLAENLCLAHQKINRMFCFRLLFVLTSSHVQDDALTRWQAKNRRSKTSDKVQIVQQITGEKLNYDKLASQLKKLCITLI